jgi:nucleotidyltransferase substrate binding protein (TIGR01987 family)
MIRMTPHTADDKPRWLYRFDHFTRALAVLREDVQTMRTRQFSDREKRGVIQSFEFTWELAWKTLKDYLESVGLAVKSPSPSSIIKQAFAARLIEDGELWMKSIETRNETCHIYNSQTFDRILTEIDRDYYALFESLYRALLDNIPPGSLT